MSDQAPNPATGNGTRQQPGNAVCRHGDSQPAAWHVLTLDGVPVAQSRRSGAIVARAGRMRAPGRRVAMRRATEPAPGVEVLP